ncbi:hypothetical protein HispidOSU_016448, partial [Sigmodon hispidus]
ADGKVCYWTNVETSPRPSAGTHPQSCEKEGRILRTSRGCFKFHATVGFGALGKTTIQMLLLPSFVAHLCLMDPWFHHLEIRTSAPVDFEAALATVAVPVMVSLNLGTGLPAISHFFEHMEFLSLS